MSASDPIILLPTTCRKEAVHIWVVERTLAWLGRNRRLAKDFEQTIASATAWLFIASVQLFARRIARS